MNGIDLRWPEAKALCILNLSHFSDNIKGNGNQLKYCALLTAGGKKSEGKTGKNFGFLATRLTLRIYVPQRSKAMLGGLTLTDGFHCHGSRNTKNGT